MSIYSDYKVGALSDYEFREACKEENRLERAYIDDFERDYYENENEDLQIDLEGEE